jgi:Bacterial SH3 domain
MPILGLPRNLVAAQQLNTATPTANAAGASTNAYVTVTYIEPINVRSGPSSFDYPVVGSLPVGGTAPAIGRSPASEWIEIVFADAPRGTGWVYAANVSLSADALLPVVEPPPTPAPVMTPTLNPTFVAAFQTLPTSTRLPTFTPPPDLAFPTYSNPAVASSSRAITAWVIVILGLVGILGIVLTSFRRR